MLLRDATPYDLSVEVPTLGGTHRVPYAEADQLSEAIEWISRPPPEILSRLKNGHFLTVREPAPWREVRDGPHGPVAHPATRVVAFSLVTEVTSADDSDDDDEYPPLDPGNLAICTDSGFSVGGRRCDGYLLGLGRIEATDLVLPGTADDTRGYKWAEAWRTCESASALLAFGQGVGIQHQLLVFAALRVARLAADLGLSAGFACPLASNTFALMDAWLVGTASDNDVRARLGAIRRAIRKSDDEMIEWGRSEQFESYMLQAALNMSVLNRPEWTASVPNQVVLAGDLLSVDLRLPSLAAIRSAIYLPDLAFARLVSR